MTSDDFLNFARSCAPWRLRDDINRIELLITQLEAQMTLTTDAIARLNTETDELAVIIRGILDREANLDARTADELNAVVTRLDVLGADAQNPVPTPEPTPEPPVG